MKIKEGELSTLIGYIDDYLDALKAFKEDTHPEFAKAYDYAREVFGCAAHAAADVIFDMLRVKPNVENEDIYKVFEILGYEVME